MSASRQYAASSGVCDAQHLTSPNINPDSPTSQLSNSGHSAGRDTASEVQEGHKDAPFNALCHAAAGLRYMQNVGYGATFQENAIGNCSLDDEISEADYKSTNSEAGTCQQAGSHSITKLSKSFEETQNSAQSKTSVEMLVRDAKMSPGTPLLLPSGAQLEAVATRGAEAPQVGTGNALGKLGSVSLNKRRREQTSNLSAVDTNESSDDGTRGSKRSKVDCDCEDDHSWWMTVKIGDMNEALHRIDAAIGLVMKLAYGSNDLNNVIINNLDGLLKSSREILDSAKDDIRAEGGINREATE
ncbi:hypothetical protein BKA65DRAFT_544992 [Rhexocercosporidium sp. MPI-PUGE-AT-0058]|nr:hypothetical protein BKA65DRAFT_544992 [Rhexocercosporidium sp. MPI-PUGE-AT-0058]